MKVRRSILVLTLVALALPVVIFARRANQEARQLESASTQNLTQYVAATGDVEVIVSAIGAVEADQVTRLSFTTPGRIVEMRVKAGDQVHAGEVLARQTDEAQRLALDAAQLALSSAQLQKDRLLAGPTESDLAVAQANVNAAMAAYSSAADAISPEQVHAAELQVQAAQQALADAQDARAHANGSPDQISLLDAQVGEASFNAEIARLNLDTVHHGSTAQSGAAWARVRQAQAEFDRLQAPPPQSQIDSADAAIARAQIELDRAQQNLDRMTLTAPFDGTITAVTGKAGSIALPSLPVVELSDLSPLRVKVQVDEIDVRQVSAGMTARVRVDALPDVDMSAQLESVALVPTIDGGIVTYDVMVVIPQADPRVRLGMTAEAQVVVQRREGVLVVPNQYIRLDRRTGAAYVNLLQPDGALVETPVTLGLQGADSSEITAGLRAGDIVAVNLGGDTIPGLGG